MPISPGEEGDRTTGRSDRTGRSKEVQHESSGPHVDAIRVLVVEDDPGIREIVVPALEAEGFNCRVAEDGRAGVESTRSFQPHVILLDLHLPKLNGLDVCKEVRSFSDAYVLMLTASDDQVDTLVGLSVGADDYMTKPFDMREVVARIRALVRRSRSVGEQRPVPRAFGNLVVDPATREVLVQGRAVELTRIEFELLDVFTADPRVVISKRRLLDRVWGPDALADDHVVDVHVSNLRRKIGRSYIQTVRGVGYRLTDAA